MKVASEFQSTRTGSMRLPSLSMSLHTTWVLRVRHLIPDEVHAGALLAACLQAALYTWKGHYSLRWSNIPVSLVHGMEGIRQQILTSQRSKSFLLQAGNMSMVQTTALQQLHCSGHWKQVACHLAMTV